MTGTGASGKSTIARQMRVLYMNGFTDKDTSIFTEIIFFNIIKNMKTLVQQAEKFGFELIPANRAAAEELKNMSMQLSDVELTSERGSGIAALWKDPGIKVKSIGCLFLMV
jgi:guanine nucleotide-binding protein G(i) subunit alpha